MARCRRCGVRSASGRAAARTSSIRRWMRALQLAKSSGSWPAPGPCCSAACSAVIGFGTAEILQHLALEHFDLLLGGVKTLLAESGQRGTPLIRGEGRLK